MYIFILSIIEFCFLEMDPGPCTNFETRWAYDTARGACTTFQYGGCGGNSNNFPAEEYCQYYCNTTQGRVRKSNINQLNSYIRSDDTYCKFQTVPPISRLNNKQKCKLVLLLFCRHLSTTDDVRPVRRISHAMVLRPTHRLLQPVHLRRLRRQREQVICLLLFPA